MRFEVFGAVGLVRDDGERIELPSRKRRQVLALLLLHANEWVRTDRIGRCPRSRPGTEPDRHHRDHHGHQGRELTAHRFLLAVARAPEPFAAVPPLVRDRGRCPTCRSIRRAGTRAVHAERDALEGVRS